MNFRFVLLILSAIIYSSLFMTGCGYKPTSHYAKDEISGKVYVTLNVDINNATNSVLVKDSVNDMIISQFGATLTYDKNQADTIVDVSLGSVSFVSLQSDDEGYAKLYRTTISVNLTYHNIKKDIKKSLSVTGSYDYAIDSDSLITDAKKTESVSIAVQKALDEVFSQIAVQSFKKENIKKN